MAKKRVRWRSLRRVGWPGYWASDDGRIEVEDWVLRAHPDLVETSIMKLTREQQDILAEQLNRALNPRWVRDEFTWDCEHDHSQVIRILGDMGLSYQDIEEVVEDFDQRGGHCDCEVMLNVLCGPEGDDDEAEEDHGCDGGDQ
jgi:hypothetical protein